MEPSRAPLQSFVCPISQDVMADPVMACDGHSYERRYIEEWFAVKSTSPVTNTPLEDTTLVPNEALKKAIDEFESYDSREGFLLLMSAGLRTAFHCPLSDVVMADPVVLACDGNSYDRTALMAYLESHTTSPTTGIDIEVDSPHLVLPNHALKQAMAECDVLAGPTPPAPSAHVAPPTSGEGICHPGVSCDGCNTSPIYGIRYKSSVTDDFDLCAACEASAIFGAHEPFLVITDSDTFRTIAATSTLHHFNLEPTTAVAVADVACVGCQVSPIAWPRYQSMMFANINVCASCNSTGAFTWLGPCVKFSRAEVAGAATPGGVYRLNAAMPLLWTPSPHDAVYRMNGDEWTLPDGTLVTGVWHVEVVSQCVFLRLELSDVPGGDELASGDATFVFIAIADVESLDDDHSVEHVMVNRALSVLHVKHESVPLTKWPPCPNTATHRRAAWVDVGEVVSTDASFDANGVTYFRVERTGLWLSGGRDGANIERLDVVAVDAALCVPTLVQVMTNCRPTNGRVLSSIQPDTAIEYHAIVCHHEAKYLRATINHHTGWIALDAAEPEAEAPPTFVDTKALAMEVPAGDLILLAIQMDAYALVWHDMAPDGTVQPRSLTSNVPELARRLDMCASNRLRVTQVALGPQREWYCSAVNPRSGAGTAWTSANAPPTLKACVEPNAVVAFGPDQSFVVCNSNGSIVSSSNNVWPALVDTLRTLDNVKVVVPTTNGTNDAGFLVVADSLLVTNVPAPLLSNACGYGLGPVCGAAALNYEHVVWFENTFLATRGTPAVVVDAIEAFYFRHHKVQRQQRQDKSENRQSSRHP